MKTRMLIAAAIFALLVAGCTSTSPDVSSTTTDAPTPAPMTESAPTPPPPAPPPPPPVDNVLLQPWTGPYSGVPPFDKVKVADFKPALEAAMVEQLAEADRIAADPAPPTFENTIAALERTGRTFDRVTTVYGIWSSTMNTPDFQVVEREMAPKLAEFSDKIVQNEPLFRRIETVYNSPEKANLTPEQQRLTWVYYKNFVRSGAKLDATAKKRLSEINQQLAGLFTRFSQNVLADESNQTVVLESEADLAGLPPSLRDSAAAAATAKGMQGKWVITNTRSSVDPFLTYSERRGLREKVWRMFVNRGDTPGEHDNNAIITEILQLRAERAKLLAIPPTPTGASRTPWRRPRSARSS